MIFWISLGLGLIFAVVAFRATMDAPLLAILSSIATLVVFVMVSLGIGTFLGYLVEAQPEKTVNSEQQYDLKSIESSQSSSGKSFLFSGYVEEKRVINYAVKEGNETTFKSAKADDSKVVEDGKTEVTVREVSEDYWWWAPFPHTKKTITEFHVPQNSLSESYKM